MHAYRGPPMTLGNAAAAKLRLNVWCRDCRHKVDVDPADQAARYGAATTVPDWRARLVCGQCGSHAVDMVVSGEEHRAEAPIGLNRPAAAARGCGERTWRLLG